MSVDWHTMSAGEALAALNSGSGGLDEEEAAHRLATNGPNRLPEKPRRSALALFLDQFKSLLPLMLLGAGLLAGLVGDTPDMVAILVVTLFNTVLGFHQERRAGRILDALKRMLAQQARVRRGGRRIEVAAERLVPGDVACLGAGDRVPADGRLVAAHGLEIDESTLTGESQAVAKTVDALPAAATPLAERSCLAFMNTVVTHGRGELLVTATGGATEMGRIAGLLEEVNEGATPLQVRLDQLGRRLAAIAGVVVAVILAQGLLRGEPLTEVVLTAVALAVAAIPEGLPAVVTVTLAIGMYRMAAHGAIAKRLAAVETLGSTTVICSDKTGTLTLNQMTARAGWAAGRRFTVSGEGYGGDGRLIPADGLGPLPDLSALLLPAALCTEARLVTDADGNTRVVGDPTEGALLVLAGKARALPAEGRWQRLAELPFDSARKVMATLHGEGPRTVLLVKGAPDVVMDMCSTVMDVDGPRPLGAAERDRLKREIDRMGATALRVLALAGGEVPARGLQQGPLHHGLLHHLCLHALLGLADPPRPGARDAVAACRAAGIAVKMITGDHHATAAAIAHELTLDGDVVTGADLDLMDDGTLRRRIDDIAVFARVAPEHKVRIVRALQALGHVAAMTGDGVNDAAALKSADIGVAMGRTGADVTREAAAMVLTDDDFATVVGAVREGRTIFDNIVKFVRFQLSTNVGALLTVFLAPLLGLPVPFHPIQILWVNIIMDGPPAMALAFDPPRPGVMAEPPRPPGDAILSLHRLVRLAVYGATMAAGTLAVFAYAGESLDRARTLAFTTFVLFQFFNLFNARVGAESVFNRNFFDNGKLWLALAAVIGLQAVVVHWPPAQAVFHTTALAPADWALAAAVASLVMVLDEGRKLVQRLVARVRLPAATA
jgi:P-type Ca2+ transporter type 2C